ncbi:MAG: alpha-amylase/4-alpha-glucanotransferase domain-containing protein [Verrucomicrobiota bacterium]
MKKQVHLQLAFHHHQPVGNLPWVLEDCYQNAYRPLMECLLDYPALKVHLSYSGPLLRFLEREHPEYLDWIRELVDQERVEFLATGFYEPVLVDIPVKDQIGQLEMSCRWIEERFGQRPKGVWLAEFVWKNFIASSFKELGLEYTLINSNRFLQAGIPKAEVNGHYFTEYLGDTVALFPVDRQMVDFIPFGEKQDALTYLRRQANRGDVSVTFADVAERWGVWPGTYQKIQQSGVAAEWFKTIAESDWIRCRFFQEELEWSPSHGRCYLPEGASIELGAWSLPDMARARYYEAKDQLGRRHDAEWFLPYFRAGSWEGFRARYGEAHLMAKKGEWLRKLMKPEEIDQVVVDSLWQAQCNTAYWHGTSGGIYLPHLREAIWKHLLSAHRRLNEDIEDLQLIEEDFDADGIDEIITHNDKTSCIIAPAQGGAIVELSLLQPLVNLSNTLTRRSEVTPEGGKRTEGPIDPYERHWFHEHFFERQTLVKNLKLNQKADKGDLVHQSARVISLSHSSQAHTQYALNFEKLK